MPACQLLFGAQACITIGFLESLQEEHLKRAFRQRAFETHPDRALQSGLDPIILTRRFQEVNEARELLNRYLLARAADPLVTPASAAPASSSSAAPRNRKAPPKSPPRNAKAGSERADGRPGREAPHSGGSRKPDAPSPSDIFWSGRLPERPLPLGEFLFYSGRISLQALIAAIHQQRQQRPVLGQLAVQRGYMSASTLAQLVARKRAGERIGDAAVRLHVLSAFQRDVLVGVQLSRQRPFGRYFTDAGIITEPELGDLVRRARLHSFWRARSRAS